MIGMIEKSWNNLWCYQYLKIFSWHCFQIFGICPFKNSRRRYYQVFIFSYLWNYNICYIEILCILGIVDTVVTKEGRKMWNHVRECAQVAFLPNWVLYKYINVCDFYVLISRTKNKCNLCTMKYIRIMFVLAYETSARAFWN